MDDKKDMNYREHFPGECCWSCANHKEMRVHSIRHSENDYRICKLMPEKDNIIGQYGMCDKYSFYW